MYIIKKYDDLSLMDTPQEKSKQVFKHLSHTLARETMCHIAGGRENGSWVLWQKDGEAVIRLQTIVNEF